MSKALLYRLFGVGKIPARLADELATEGVLVQDEGVKGTITFVDFRAPGRHAKWKRQWFGGAFALTERRFVALRSGHTILDVPLDDARFAGLACSLEGADTLRIDLDASVFEENATGRVELRYRSPLVSDLLYQLRERTN